MSYFIYNVKKQKWNLVVYKIQFQTMLSTFWHQLSINTLISSNAELYIISINALFLELNIAISNLIAHFHQTSQNLSTAEYNFRLSKIHCNILLSRLTWFTKILNILWLSLESFDEMFKVWHGLLMDLWNSCNVQNNWNKH